MPSSPPSSPPASAQVRPQVRPQDAAAELLRRRAARRRLVDFTAYTFPGYRRSWHHDLLCDHLDAFAAGGIKRLIIEEPPQHGKSEHVSRRLPAKMLGDNPDEEVLGVSYGFDLAADMSRDVQAIMGGPEYQRLYPAVQLAQRATSGEEKSVRRFTIPGRRGRYTAAGVGGPITGRGFSKLILDDYHKNREEADSPIIRAKVWKWYTSTFYTRRRDDNAGVLITATRWNQDDLVGRLKKLAAEDPKADQWTVLTLPAIATDARHPQDPRQPGEALWPERHSLESLLKFKAANPYDFASLYQQDPQSQGIAEWPASYFPDSIWFDQWPAAEELRHKVLTLDPSKGRDSKHGDYAAFVLLGRDKDGVLWCEAFLERVPAEELAKMAVSIQAYWQAQAFGPETNGFQSLLAGATFKLARERGVHLPTFPIENYENKVVRIRQLGGLFSQRAIRFRATPGTRLLVKQLEQFPIGDHDDGPDALEMAVRLMNYLLTGNLAFADAEPAGRIVAMTASHSS